MTASTRIRAWIAEPVLWREFRGILGLPATFVACLLVFWLGLVILPFALGITIVFALPALFCNGLVIAALAAACRDLLGMEKGARIRRAVILAMWLAVECVRFPFWPKDSWLWEIALRIAGGDAISEFWGKLFILEVEWVTVIATLWLLVESVLPRPDVQRRGPARGWCMLLLLVELVGAATIHLTIGHHQVNKLMRSPATLVLRTEGPGTIGQALCHGDYAHAEERVEKLGAALRDDELLWLVEFCVRQPATPASTAETTELRARLMGSLARLIVAHRLAIDAGGYCGAGADAFLWALYGDAFTPEYLASVKESGLQMDCLVRKDDDVRYKKKGEPIWWRAVIDQGRIDAATTGVSGSGQNDAEEGKKRLLLLKQLGIHLAQKDVQGHDLLSRVDGRNSNEWIEALVDEGLDPDQSSDIDRTPLRIRMLYRRYGIDNADSDVGAAVRVSEKIGDPPAKQLRQALGAFNNIAHVLALSKASDELQTRLWAWVADKVGPGEVLEAMIEQHVEEGAGPKLKALIGELNDRHQRELRDE